MVKNEQLKLVTLCEENLKISSKINSIKKELLKSGNLNVLLEIHEEELKTLLETYVHNSIKVGECVIILGLDENNFMLN